MNICMHNFYVTKLLRKARMMNTKFRIAVTFGENEANRTENGLLGFESIGEVSFLSNL